MVRADHLRGHLLVERGEVRPVVGEHLLVLARSPRSNVAAHDVLELLWRDREQQVTNEGVEAANLGEVVGPL